MAATDMPPTRVAFVMDVSADLGMVLNVVDVWCGKRSALIHAIKSEHFQHCEELCHRLGFGCYARLLEDVLPELRR